MLSLIKLCEQNVKRLPCILSVFKQILMLCHSYCRVIAVRLATLELTSTYAKEIDNI